MAGRPLRRAKLRKNYGTGRRMAAEDGVPTWAVGMDAEWYEMHYAPKKPQSVEDARKKIVGPKLTKKQQAEMDAEYAGEARHAKRYRNPSLRDYAAAVTSKAAKAGRVGAEAVARMAEEAALEVLAKEHGYKLVKANPRSKSLAGWQDRSHQNPAGWMHDESSRAVRRAIATRSPDDIRSARALQVRNEKARSKERMRLPNPKKNGTCPCGCGGKCGKKNPIIEWGTFRNGGNGKVAGDKNTYAIERVYRSGTLPDGWRVLYDDYYSKISRNASSRHVSESGDIVRDVYPSVQYKTVFASMDDAKSAAELHAARHPVVAKPKKARS